MFPQYSISVSISQAKAFVVCLQKKMGNVSVFAQDVVDFHGTEKLQSRMDILVSYLAGYLEDKRIPDASLFIGFPRELSITKVIDLPAAVKETLLTSIGYSIEKYLPLKSQDIYYDCAVLCEDKKSKTMQVMLAAARKTDMVPYLDFAVSVDQGLSGVLFEPLAVADFIAYHFRSYFEKNENLFLFYADKFFVDVTLVKNHKIAYTRSVAYQDQAGAMAFFTDEIDRFAHQNSRVSEVCALFCGPGVDAQIINTMVPSAEISVEKEFLTCPGLKSHDFLSAAGLAMAGLELDTLAQVNLLPVSKRKKASKKAVYLMVGLTVAVIVLCLIWAGSVAVKQNMVNTKLDGQLDHLSEQAGQIRDKQKKIAGLESKFALVNTIVETRVSINDVMAEISRILPKDTWIGSFSYSMGKKVRIEGYSDMAADLIPMIEASDLFENCSFLSAITRTQGKKEKFFIGFDIVGQTE